MKETLTEDEKGQGLVLGVKMDIQYWAWELVLGATATVDIGCEGWCQVWATILDVTLGVGQGGACCANFLMGRCSRLPWRQLHYLFGIFDPEGDTLV